ncbi:MAG: GMC family oxidoreductase [Planctomycetaceae bacterium]|nr:MAG: GMC family oxidoreductase [Planctomycetaceae bacterium]
MPDPFDFLIVGGGSAGCVVARVLADRGWRIGLIEPGPDQPASKVPADYLRAFRSAEDWDFETEPQPALAGRRIRQPRGRGLGGSTRINAMIWYPPRDVDLRRLARHGGTHWSAADLRASLTEVTTWVSPESPRWLSEASSRFLKVARPAIEPPHAYHRMSDRSGRRTAAELLTGCDRIRRITGSVDRVLFAEGTESPGLAPAGAERSTRATGVWLRPDALDSPHVVSANRGVILCSGSLGSPCILIRSGIGPRDVLQTCGIRPRLLLEAVGRNLIDHLIMPCIFELPESARFAPRPTPRDLARWQVSGSGPLSSNLAEVGAIYPLVVDDNPKIRRPRQTDTVGQTAETAIQVHVTPTHYLLHPDSRAPAAMTIGVNLCQPRSRGRVWPVSVDSTAAPSIDPGYLTSPEDLTELVAAVGVARELASSPPLASWVCGESLPGVRRDSTAATERAIRRYAQTLYHPVGTCRMSALGDGVVDPDCRVKGTHNLWVIDAAVLGDIPSVNPNATIMMLAHLAATRLAV